MVKRTRRGPRREFNNKKCALCQQYIRYSKKSYSVMKEGVITVRGERKQFSGRISGNICGKCSRDLRAGRVDTLENFSQLQFQPDTIEDDDFEIIIEEEVRQEKQHSPTPDVTEEISERKIGKQPIEETVVDISPVQESSNEGSLSEPSQVIIDTVEPSGEDVTKVLIDLTIPNDNIFQKQERIIDFWRRNYAIKKEVTEKDVKDRLHDQFKAVTSENRMITRQLDIMKMAYSNSLAKVKKLSRDLHDREENLRKSLIRIKNLSSAQNSLSSAKKNVTQMKIEIDILVSEKRTLEKKIKELEKEMKEIEKKAVAETEDRLMDEWAVYLSKEKDKEMETTLEIEMSEKAMDYVDKTNYDTLKDENESLKKQILQLKKRNGIIKWKPVSVSKFYGDRSTVNPKVPLVICIDSNCLLNRSECLFECGGFRSTKHIYEIIASLGMVNLVPEQILRESNDHKELMYWTDRWYEKYDCMKRESIPKEHMTKFYDNIRLIRRGISIVSIYIIF